ncbi:agmatinase family protein [Marinococcus halophilus]|uniref:agmatinase family protein n=1 Tax=Marinococcus halophilus TaxID=1371 RepID=UPI0009A57290|nr:agmatinase family protein [Marinococcus halophilus]
MNRPLIYGNTPTFLHASSVAKDLAQAANYHATIYGVPWEGAVTWGAYTGCELGPKVIRQCSERYSGYLPELDDIDVLSYYSLADAGDVSTIPADVPATMETIQSFASSLWASGTFPVGLGGDHGITYPVVRALGETTGKKIGIIHIDAHFDNNDESMGDEFGRGSPFARMYEYEQVRNESLVHLGIHGPRNKAVNGRSAKEAGAVTITIDKIRSAPDLKAFAKEVYDIAADGTDEVYLSICSDILDYAYNPGGPADANGLHPEQLLTLIHEFGSYGVCGMDFVEVYPQQDQNDFSSHFVTLAILYVLAGRLKQEGKA